MANWTRLNEDLEKHEKGEKLNPRAQKMFGIIRDVYRKINRSKPATVSPTCETMRALRDFQVEFEERKSGAVAHLYRYNAFNY